MTCLSLQFFGLSVRRKSGSKARDWWWRCCHFQCSIAGQFELQTFSSSPWISHRHQEVVANSIAASWFDRLQTFLGLSMSSRPFQNCWLTNFNLVKSRPPPVVQDGLACPFEMEWFTYGNIVRYITCQIISNRPNQWNCTFRIYLVKRHQAWPWPVTATLSISTFFVATGFFYESWQPETLTTISAAVDSRRAFSWELIRPNCESFWKGMRIQQWTRRSYHWLQRLLAFFRLLW